MAEHDTSYKLLFSHPRMVGREFGSLTDEQRRRVREADAGNLLERAERVLTPDSIEEVLGEVGDSG